LREIVTVLKLIQTNYGHFANGTVRLQIARFAYKTARIKSNAFICFTLQSHKHWIYYGRKLLIESKNIKRRTSHIIGSLVVYWNPASVGSSLCTHNGLLSPCLWSWHQGLGAIFLGRHIGPTPYLKHAGTV